MSAASLQWRLDVAPDSSADVPTLVVSGRLGTAGAASLRGVLAGLPASKRVRLDLREVDYVSSAGIEALHDFARRSREAGGALEVVAASEPVRLAFRLAPVPDLLIVE